MNWLAAGARIGVCMTTFVIRTEEEQDLGFLLFARRDSDWPSAGSYDCIFTGFPRDTSLWEDARGLFVMDHKGREWEAEVSYAETERAVRTALDSGWVFELHSNEAGNYWIAERDNTTVSGTGEFL